MASGNLGRRGPARGDYYLDLIDLYATRAYRAKTVQAEDTRPIIVTSIGRRQRSLPRSIWTSSQHLRARRIRIASAATAALIAISVLAGAALADQQYRVQERGSITIVGEKIRDDPVAILESSSLDTPEHLDPGQKLTIAGMHVMTAHGYDEPGVNLSDPASGLTRFYDWATFLRLLGTSDGVGLAVYPV